MSSKSCGRRLLKGGLARVEPQSEHWRRLQDKKARAEKLALDKLKRGKQARP